MQRLPPHFHLHLLACPWRCSLQHPRHRWDVGKWFRVCVLISVGLPSTCSVQFASHSEPFSCNPDERDQRKTQPQFAQGMGTPQRDLEVQQPSHLQNPRSQSLNPEGGAPIGPRIVEVAFFYPQETPNRNCHSPTPQTQQARRFWISWVNLLADRLGRVVRLSAPAGEL